MHRKKEAQDSVIDVSKEVSENTQQNLPWRIVKIIAICSAIAVVITFITVFVIIPLVFMFSIELQRLLMFTNIFLTSDQSEFEKYLKPGMRNIYITVKSQIDGNLLSLGAYDILPENITTDEELFNNNYTFQNYSVILYFHGSGEDRTDSVPKYEILKKYFHVIAFDYRSYGDSTSAELSENAIVEDSIQIYKWVRQKTNTSIFIWGHSLGSSLATNTVAKLKQENIFPTGLVLEAPFTSMKEEIPVHPYGKIFAWLPWFDVTILEPLQKSQLVFETDKYILNVECPIMILHSEDDSIIPYTLGKKLYEIAQTRRNNSKTIYHQFNASYGYDHFFLYQDKDLLKYIEDFIILSNEKR